MDLKLTGKRALVTGSSSGIGAEIARMLAGEGATVLVHGRNQERVDAVVAQIRAAGGHAEAILGEDLVVRNSASKHGPLPLSKESAESWLLGQF